jgi:hypothetical protein
MENRGLLFIPDISGFTRFVNETEIGHSRLIIQELLESLINANESGLEVSEIEGDAILFYKFGEAPALEELYRQVEKMFCVFHRSLIAYDNQRYCQCQACVSAINLSLKVITHYGEFADYHVKNFKKLIGKDIIVAHQLLKNDIEQHEYWLVTKSLVRNEKPADLAEWMEWNSGAKQTEAGEIPFHYTQLSELKNELVAEPLPELKLSEKAKMVSVSHEYETDIITLFHATGAFQYRSRWREGVKSVEEVGHYLPRVGMRARSVLDSGEVTTYSTSYFYRPDRIEFSETQDNNKKGLTYYTLEKTAGKKTKFTLDYYISKDPVAEILFKLTKKRKMEDNFRRSLQNLVPLGKELKIPTAGDR